jgi:C-terminal processing protease CtpA/Prc
MFNWAIAQQVDSVARVLDSIIAHAEQASLFRDKVDWPSLKAQVKAEAQNAVDVKGLGPALKTMLKALGDEHGRVFYQNKFIAYYYGELKEHQKDVDTDIYNQIQGGVYYPFMAQMLEGNVGYIRIVGLPMGDNQAMAKVIQDEVCKLIEQGAKTWILDLRYNGGGNLLPMAEGITAILGDGHLGGALGLTPAENSSWDIKKGDFYFDDYSVQLPNDCNVKGLPKVAVLTSVYTASSGEALAVMFKGRKKTRFFGEKTLGMITVTNWQNIDAETNMSISVSYYQDRKGHAYTNYVDVDETSAFVVKPLSEEDLTVKKALAWLK